MTLPCSCSAATRSFLIVGEAQLQARHVAAELFAHPSLELIYSVAFVYGDELSIRIGLFKLLDLLVWYRGRSY